MIEQIIFYSLSLVAVGSALGVVLHRNAVHSSLFLGLSLAAVAGLYALLGADFLFGAQIMVYVSGIAVLVMFVVMLLGRASDLHLRQVNERWPWALLVCAVAAVGMLKIVGLFAAKTAQTSGYPATHAIGRLMLGEWLLPFEMISLVLLAALFGAVFFTRAENAQ